MNPLRFGPKEIFCDRRITKNTEYGVVGKLKSKPCPNSSMFFLGFARGHDAKVYFCNRLRVPVIPDLFHTNKQ